MRIANIQKGLITGAAAATAAGLATVLLVSGSSTVAAGRLADDVGPVQSSHKAIGQNTSGEQADKYMQVNMRITNDTGETLVLQSEHADKNNKWQARPVDLAPGQIMTANVYSATTAHMWLTYESQDSHTIFTFDAKTPFAGFDSTSASSSSSSYTIQHTAGLGGDSPLDEFDVLPADVNG
jgi:hypothetical protein